MNNKIKTSKSMYKRFKVTAGGKLLRRKAMKSHLLQKKTANRKKNLRKVAPVYVGDIMYFKHKLPYIN